MLRIVKVFREPLAAAYMHASMSYQMYWIPAAAITNYWLETTEMYSLTILETRSLKSGCQEGHTPCGESRGVFAPCCFQLLMSAGIC